MNSNLIKIDWASEMIKDEKDVFIMFDIYISLIHRV
jgi:hypothetical protein